MVAINNATDDRDGPISALDAAMPTIEEELEDKARALRLKDDDAGNNKESPASSALSSAACDDPDLLPEERWNEAWQSHLESLKKSYSGPDGLPEHELRNFLIYVHGDPGKATERINKYLAWRRAHLPIDCSTILAPLRQRLFFFKGKDRAGHPIGYFRLQGHDRKKRDVEQYVRAVVYVSEALVTRMGGSDYRVTLVIDRRGANLFNQDLELYKSFFKTFGELYPMKLFRVILYPATTMTRVLWSMLRPFVHSHVQRRLALVSDLAGFGPYIAQDQLLESLGGALPDMDEDEALAAEEAKES